MSVVVSVVGNKFKDGRKYGEVEVWGKLRLKAGWEGRGDWWVKLLEFVKFS